MATRSSALLYQTLVFLCGTVAGALAMNLYEHSHHIWPGDPPKPVRHVIEEMQKELVLTAEQSRQLEAITDETMRQFEDLHSQAHQVRQQAMARIQDILNAEQKVKFEKLQKHLGVAE